jgi:hypothetical protein
MEKKTICDLCKQLRELIKYIDDPKIEKANELIDYIQYRAHNMETGLFKSKFNVGKPIYKLLKSSDILTEESRIEIINIIEERWKNLD